MVWETAAEFDNLGFRIYRRLEGEADFTLLTPDLILGRGTTDLSALYAYHDLGAPNGVEAEYLLEDIEFDGDSTLHGPVVAAPRAGAGEVAEHAGVVGHRPEKYPCERIRSSRAPIAVDGRRGRRLMLPRAASPRAEALSSG